MGCKTSVVRREGSTGCSTPEENKAAASPSTSPSKLKHTGNSSQTTAGPTSEATQQGNSGLHKPAAAPGQGTTSRTSLPTSPRRASSDTSHECSALQQQQQVTYAQDDDPFAPPPPLLPLKAVGKSNSVLTLHVHSTSSDEDEDEDEDDEEDERDIVRRNTTEAGRLENHFDPIPMPQTALVDAGVAEKKERVAPRLPSADSRTVSKEAKGTFRTSISDHDKTDSAQAAKEYQQRLEAKRTAEEVHTKRRRLEEFDPVRPVDSFNVTHRGLLGRCWDRRAPELIPVSFVHAIAKALGVEESHPASTTTVSHTSGGDEFPPGSPMQHLSRLSRQSGGQRGSNAAAPPLGLSTSWMGIGGRRVPRRSHWFSVGGISTDGLASTAISSPNAAEPFYVSSVASSPTVPRAAPTLVFPSASAALLIGSGGLAMRNASVHIIRNPAVAGNEHAKPSPKKAASSTKAGGIPADALDDSTETKTLTSDQVKALPWETREKYFNLILSRNPRFMGIKDTFAFKLGEGVSTDRSVKFLLKRNLEPAPGVTAVRWNRVEFFHPSLHTLVRAVAKTQGMSVELSQIAQASSRAEEEGEAATTNEGNSSVLGLHANGSPLNRMPNVVVVPASTRVDDVPEAGAAATAAAERDGALTVTQEIMHRSFSQCVMGQMENQSFARGRGGGEGGGVRSANGSFLNNTTNISGSVAQQGDRNSTIFGAAEKSGDFHLTRGPGSFLMGLHRSHGKDADSSGLAAPLWFPEDSVLALALGMPYSRLGQLSGVPAAVRNAALTNAGRLSGNLFHPFSAGLGSRKASKDTLNSTTNGGGSTGGGGFSSSRGSGYAPLRVGADTVLVSLSVSCFSVSINPFEWQERHYTRFPVDIDGSKRSARSNYGEGVITDVMYGGLMVVECSSMEAEKELQGLLMSMTWTEERSLHGIVKDVRKHLKSVHNNLQKSRQAAAKRGGEAVSNAPGGKPASEEATKDWSAHRYRIIRRIGGRPMRDAVELEEICVFFDDDEAVREERTTLHAPKQRTNAPVATKQRPAAEAEASGRARNSWQPSSGPDKSPAEARSSIPHSSPNAPDPDITSSFSRVASAWFGLPVISAVLRTWGLHLLASPEYAQPTAMFLQKHAGLAPVLHLTALGSFYHEGNTPSDEGDGANDADYLFFESDGPAYEDARRTASLDAHHPQPTPRIPKYNRFYASLPPSPTSARNDEHRHHRNHRDSGKEEEEKEEGNHATTTQARGAKERKGLRKAGSLKLKPGDKDAPTAASSPAHLKSSSATLDEMPSTQRNRSVDDVNPRRLRVRETTQTMGNDTADNETHPHLGPRSHSKETVEGGDAAVRMADSQNGSTFPPAGDQQSIGIMSATDSGVGSASVRKHKGRNVAARPAPIATSAASLAGSGNSSAPPKIVAATRPSSRCNSPLSPGKITVPHSRRNNSHRRASSCVSIDSAASTSSSSSSSFFETSSSNNTRHSTFVYLPNTKNSTSVIGGASVDESSKSTSRLERNSTALPQASSPPLSNNASVIRPAVDNTSHIAVPSSADGVLNISRPSSTSTVNSKSGSPHFFMPSPLVGSDGVREATISEIVAMAKTVGPGDSVAMQDARRRANANGEMPLPHGAIGAARSPLGRRGSGGGIRRASVPAVALPSSMAHDAAITPNSDTPTAASERSGGGKAKTKKKKAKTQKATATSVSESAKAPPSAKPDTAATQIIVKCRPTTKEAPPPLTTAIDAVDAQANQPSLPIAPSAGVCDVKEAQIQSLGTPSGVSHSTSALALATANVSQQSTSVAVNATAPHGTEEEAEGLWYMTMLEVKAQRQELDDLRLACRNAEDHRQKLQDELRALNRVFLPHTHPQDLDCALLYLKTVLFEPDDVPHGRLFLQQLDWLPLLAAVWTSPANRIRSVEVAVELTWMDIPRLGLLAGLLYHHNAPGPLEELILRSDKLLGAPRCVQTLRFGGDNDDTDNVQAKKRGKKFTKKKLHDSMDLSNTSLNFVTELDRTGSGFGPGCPPFFIAPEEARDTLWLLLCAVATNTAVANFRVVLRGIPTSEIAGAGTSSSGSVDPEKERATPNPFATFFATRRREDRSEEPLLLKPGSMLLDSFVVQPTLCSMEDGNNHSRSASTFRASPPPPAKVGSSAALTQNASGNNTFDGTGLPAVTSEPLRLDSSGQPHTASNTPEHRSPNSSRQTSSLVIVTSSPLGHAISQDPLCADEGLGSGSSGRHAKRSLSTLLTLRSHNTSGHGSPTRKAPAAVMVPTHQHHVKRRPWVRDGVEVEERPFYEVLMHRCPPIDEARVAAVNLGDPSLMSTPFIAHYHHPFNATHNDARFYVSVERQAQLQDAVRRAASAANGEASLQEANEETAVYSSKKSRATVQPPASEEQQSLVGRTPSPPTPPSKPIPCPPPLVFSETSKMFGLQSAEEEAKVLLYEERQLRDRAVDIWEALRKSVKHYNHAQQEARHKAIKSAGKTAPPPPPARLITLEY